MTGYRLHKMPWLLLGLALVWCGVESFIFWYFGASPSFPMNRLLISTGVVLFSILLLRAGWFQVIEIIAGLFFTWCASAFFIAFMDQRISLVFVSIVLAGLALLWLRQALSWRKSAQVDPLVSWYQGSPPFWGAVRFAIDDSVYRLSGLDVEGGFAWAIENQGAVKKPLKKQVLACLQYQDTVLTVTVEKSAEIKRNEYGLGFRFVFKNESERLRVTEWIQRVRARYVNPLET